MNHHSKFVVTHIQRRPSTTPAFFRESSPEAAALIERVNALQTAAHGFEHQHVHLSEDRLTLTVTVYWRSKAYYRAFAVANEAFLNDFAFFSDLYFARIGGHKSTSAHHHHSPA